VRHLISKGYELAMLTGDLASSARAVASQVGLPESAVHSQLLPEDKLHLVGSSLERNESRLVEARKVLFVGDGINDAPALATADIGVSMGGGAAATMELSDVTLMDSNLTKLLSVLDMGQRVRRKVRENITLSLFCKLAVVCLTFLGYMTLLYAIASDVGVMLVVTLNGMRLLPSTKGLMSPPENAQVSSHQLQRRLGRKHYSRVSGATSMARSRQDEVALEIV
jgi:Cd2+/Zn2+-exporting ATPase